MKTSICSCWPVGGLFVLLLGVVMGSSQFSFSGITVAFETLPFACYRHSHGSWVVGLVGHLMGPGCKVWQVGAGHL